MNAITRHWPGWWRERYAAMQIGESFVVDDAVERGHAMNAAAWWGHQVHTEKINDVGWRVTMIGKGEPRK